MKIRTDFVSNSSSSSFVIAGDSMSIVAKCKLTKQDFIDALTDLGKSYMVILDKEIPEDYEKICSDYTDWLKEWYTPYLVKHINYNGTEDIEYIPPTNHIKKRECLDDDFVIPGYHFRKWERFYEMIRRSKLGDGLPYSDWTPDVTEIYRYDHKENKPIFEKINPTLYEILKDVYNSCGIITNHDALMAGFSRFLIHFGDNEVHSIKGMDEPCKYDKPRKVETDYDREYNKELETSVWETEPYSMFRFCEILMKWFKDHGKIPAEYTYTWKHLADSITACCMHEG